jgi:hypothetical protein
MKLKKNPKKISRAELKGSLAFHYLLLLWYICVLQQVDEISYEKN